MIHLEKFIWASSEKDGTWVEGGSLERGESCSRADTQVGEDMEARRRREEWVVALDKGALMILPFVYMLAVSIFVMVWRD